MEKYLPIEIYDELCRILTDFENTEYPLSDKEWLEIFYELCVKIQNSIIQ